jgi:hypothetical protein
MNDRPIPNSNEIISFFHCRRCLEEIPDGVAPREWAQNEVGFTKLGLQVWCRRHDANVIHIDFQGVQHPANTGRKESVQ